MDDYAGNEAHRRRASDEAVDWVWKLDRGLSAAEQDAFFDWLSARPENAAALTQQRENWRRMDQLASWRPEHGKRPNPDLLAPPQRTWWHRYYRPVWVAAAAALVGAVGLSLAVRNTTPRATATAEPLLPEDRRILDDGSTVKLNAGASIAVDYSAAERRVRLEQGEAFFIVEKDPSRPFIVEVNGIDVRAVGTVFNVRMAPQEVEVLVAEGKVMIAAPAPTANGFGQALPKPTFVEARQIASISLVDDVPQKTISTLDRTEIQRALSWQHSLMTFQDQPLSEIVDELNRLNEVQLVIVDPELGSTRFSGTFRSDNAQGFARLLETGFGARAEVIGEAEILLRSGTR